MIYVNPQFKNFVYYHSAGHLIIMNNEASKKCDYLKKDTQYSQLSSIQDKLPKLSSGLPSWLRDCRIDKSG